MKIVTVQFNNFENQDYALLLKVFKFSVRKHMPDIEFVEIKKDIPVNLTGRPNRFFYNDFKLKCWVTEFEKATEPIVFCDCDMLMIDSIQDAFVFDFDIAYTELTKVKKIPFNGGVMFARPTENAKIFFKVLLEVNNRMLQNRNFHKPWCKKYLGINQAELGYVLENLDMLKRYGKIPIDLKIHKFKTIVYNAVNCDWQKISIDTRMIHYKGPLRKALLEKSKSHSEWNHVLKLWKDIRKEMIKGTLN